MQEAPNSRNRPFVTTSSPKPPAGGTGRPGRCRAVGPLALACALAAPPLLAAPLDAARPLVGATWYTVSILNQRIGYAHRLVEVDEEHPGGPVLRTVQRIQARVQLKETGDVLEMGSEIISVYDAGLQPRELIVVNNEFGLVKQVRATVLEGVIDVVTEAGGREMRETFPLPADFGSDLPLVMSILRGEAKVGDRIEFDTFDPDLGKLDRHVMAITDVETLPDGREAFVVRSRGGRLPVDIITRIARDGTLVSFATPGVLNLEVVQASEQEALAVAAPLILSGRVPTNVRIADARRLEMLRVRMSAGPSPVAGLIPAGPRQQVRRDGDAAIVTITRLPAEGPSLPLPIAGEEFQPYLRPSHIAQVDDPAMVALAREIVGEETDARRAAGLIVRWVYANMRKVRSEPRLVSAREVLEQLSGDCTEHAVLCGALAAAAGIPARMVAGIAYTQGAFYYHAWNELYVGEWVEMDPAWGEEAVSAGHVKLVSGALDPEALARMALAAGRFLGNLDVEILDHRLGDGTPREGGAG